MHGHLMQVLYTAVIAIGFHDVRPAFQGVHVVTATQVRKTNYIAVVGKMYTVFLVCRSWQKQN